MLAKNIGTVRSTPFAAWRSLASLAEAPLQTVSLDGARGVIKMRGEGVVHFLQGLVTNDLAALDRAGGRPLYACVLNAQGRYLHDMFLHHIEDDGTSQTLLLDVDAQGKEDLLRLLKRYRLRLKMAIDDVSDSHGVWARFGGSVYYRGAAACSSNGTGTGADGSSWPADPRLPALGLRAVLPRDQVPSGSGGTGISSSEPQEPDWRAYRRWRVLQGVAEGDSEIPSGDVIPLEYNIDGLNGISFTKGCYVGQELMARTHFKGVVRKRLMPFRLLDSGGSGSSASSSSGIVPGGKVLLGAGGPAVGVVRAVAGDAGLAVLRLGKALPAVEAGGALVIEASGAEGGSGAAVAVRAWRPDWWPAEWGQEEGQKAGGD